MSRSSARASSSSQTSVFGNAASVGRDSKRSSGHENAGDSDKWENLSNTSTASRFSLTSIASKASSVGGSVKRHLSLPGRRRNKDEIFSPGETCETVRFVQVQKYPALTSDIIGEIPEGTTLWILEVKHVADFPGDCLKITSKGGNVQGWITSKTPGGDANVAKRAMDLEHVMSQFKPGGRYEVKSSITVRVQEDVASEAKAVLKPGAVISVLEVGENFPGRVKVSAKGKNNTPGVDGWCSVVSKEGKILVGSISAEGGKSDEADVEFLPKYMKIKGILENSVSGNLAGLRKIVDGGIMKSRFSTKPDLNCTDVRGRTALMFAAACGHREIVQYLLEKIKEGVDVNALDDTQKSALHHAAKKTRPSNTREKVDSQSQIVLLLLQNDANIEHRDHNGCTPLMFAVANGQAFVTERLMSEKANVNVADYEGRTPLDYAITFGHSRVAGMLRSVDAKQTLVTASPTKNNGSGETSLEDPSEKAQSSSNANGKAQVNSKAAVPPPPGGKLPPPPPGKGSLPGPPAATKKKHGASDTATTAGMMEAVAASAEEVTVEDEEKVSSKRERAQTKLKTLIENPESVWELKQAIEQAIHVGVEEGLITEAEQVLKELEVRAQALEELRQAISDRKVDGLRKAIEKARDTKAPEGSIEEAMEVLAEEEPRQRCREKLQEARDAHNVAQLKAAIVEARRVSLSAEELGPFEECLAAAESKDKTEALLRSAMEGRDVAGLKFAIPQAKDVGIDRKLISDAQAVLDDEEPKMKAREELAEACEKPSIQSLQAAIKVAKSAKLPQAEYAQAETLLQEEEEKERRMAAVNTMLKESKTVDLTSVDSLRAVKEKLSDVIQAAIKSGVKEGDLKDAETRRKKLHNAIEDLKGTIRVFCRVRPLSTKEKEEGSTQICQRTDMLTLAVEGEKKETFQFDSVFTPGTQAEVFEDCLDLVQSAVDGYNVTMFAYGQTGAGKTFTMYGSPGQEGAAPRTIQEVFRVIEKGRDRFTYTVMGSMLELYRNDLVDLLSKADPKASKSKLNVRMEKSGHVAVENLIEETCDSAKDLADLLERGGAQRSVAATAMNSESSRSHLVLLIKIVSVNKETKEQLRGKITLCDLAGSERLSKSLATGDVAKEAIEINKSLTALGDVIEALTKGQKSIPYRNHKLTQLMQDSLGGTSKTLMFVNCSPASSNLDETLCSLKYATRAKKITNIAQAPAAPATKASHSL